MNEQGKKVDLFNSRSISYQITAGEDQKINEEGEENELSNLIQVEESGVIDKIVELRERLNERLRAEIKTGSFLQID